MRKNAILAEVIAKALMRNNYLSVDEIKETVENILNDGTERSTEARSQEAKA